MNRTRWLALTLLLPATATAQDHQHQRAEKLGSVHFETSCAPAVAPAFDRAMALLHSFEFRDAINGFEQVLAADSTCAMAWWGIALSRWTNPMTPSIRPAPLLRSGQQAADAASRLALRATPRERAWVAAVSRLYADHEKLDQRTRLLLYEDGMATVVSAYPQDHEARIFYAISLVGASLPTDKTYAKQLRAGGMLEEMFAKQPDHPGLAHYIIHSYDYPALAAKAAAAAKRYADIAPSAAHALHMPSHTFTRVGLWAQSVATNLRSMEEAERSGAIAEALHAIDYSVYANLQMRRDSAAKALLDRLPALNARFDPNAVTGAAPGSAGIFALAASPARYALERDAWAEAAALRPRSTTVPYADAMTHLARSLGATRMGQLAIARASIDSLASLRARLASAGETYWAEQVAIQHLTASAWLALAERRTEDALRMMREAATREDATEKAAVSPGPLAPARELLADMLSDMGRHADALTEYKAALKRDANRYRSLRGAMRAAESSGNKSEAIAFARQLEQLTSGT